MSTRAGETLTCWSVSTYCLILKAYPAGFRRDFGESMAQVFGDSLRDAWRQTGMAGFAATWVRTLVDVVVSLFTAYADERRDPLFKFAGGLSTLYLVALTSVVGYGAITFGEFYQPPRFSVFGAPGAAEDTLVALYAQAQDGAFGSYRSFTRAAGFSLAVLLGITSSVFGVWQRSFWHTGAALVAGTLLTIGAFRLLPTIWFPFDRYPADALWVMGGGLAVAAATCVCAMLIGRFGPGRPRFLQS